MNEQIEAKIASAKVVIFGKGEKHEPQCGFTANVQNIFDDVFPDYEMVNILTDRGLREEIKTFSSWPTFPQIYIDGEFIGGGDIAAEMYDEGELDFLRK